MAPSRQKPTFPIEKFSLHDVDVTLKSDAIPKTKRSTIWRPYADVLSKTSAPLNFELLEVNCAAADLKYFSAVSSPQAYTFRPFIPARYTTERYWGNISDRSSERSISPDYSSSRTSSPTDMQCSPCSTSSSEDNLKSSPSLNSNYSHTGFPARHHPYVERQKRSKFSADQLRELCENFCSKKYLTLQERHELSVKLKLGEEQVKNWFQNKRMKSKRDYIHDVDKGRVIPCSNPILPKFSRMPPNYFKSIPASPVKYLIKGQDFR